MLLIINYDEVMIITKQNPAGGPMLKSFPIREDPDTGVLGYMIGYCSCGCGKPLHIRSAEVQEIVNKFGYSMGEYKKTLKKLYPKKPLRVRIIESLGGRAGD